MAKPTQQQWDKAKALYTNGKSYREIGELLQIPFSTVRDKAKSEGWKKGELAQVILDKIKVETEIRTLEPAQQDIVRSEVNKQLEAMEFYSTNARKVAKVALSGLSKEMTPAAAKTTMEVLHKGMVVEGVVPYYPNAPTINNTNAQQNNSPQLSEAELDAIFDQMRES
jgi:hypothetical protein